MPKLTQLQTKTCHAIVNVFETGKPNGDYSAVTVLKGDSGRLTYGRSQATLDSGNLFHLIKDYTEHPFSTFKSALDPYLNRLKNRDYSLDSDSELHKILKLAGSDPIMHEVQDNFFNQRFWNPAERSARMIDVTLPLGVCVIYDSRIHGSWIMIRDRTNSKHGDTKSIGQKQWIHRYLLEREHWLGNHKNSLLRRTTYRTKALHSLLNQDNWHLDLPLVIRGVTINAQVLSCINSESSESTTSVKL